MISNLDGASELFLANVSRVQDRIAKASREISSGKRISDPSDAPDQVESLLQLQANRQRNTQIQSNLALAQGEADSADSALTTAIKLMDQARTLAAQGASSALDAVGRRAIADQIQAIQQQMVDCTNTVVQGRFIFSGDSDQVEAYRMDAQNAATGVTQIAAAPATRQIEHPSGGSFAASMSAQEIFDLRDADGAVTAGNVFAALNGLRAALLDPAADATTIAGKVAPLVDAAARLNTAQAFYGSVQNRIKQAESYTSSYDTNLQAQLSQKEDADAVAAALELTQASTHLQAAFQMRAKLPRDSLFNYLA